MDFLLGQVVAFQDFDQATGRQRVGRHVPRQRRHPEVRARSRQRQDSLQGLLEAGDDLGLAADERLTPENFALSKEMLSAIAGGLATLPPDQRAAVILSDVQGLTYDEMAEAIRTGVPYSTRLDPPPADPRVAHPAR